MTSRAGQPDTPADWEVRACLDADPPRSFIMVAGAGSGKTTSLVKALASLVRAHGRRLETRRQRVACITYTEVAAAEVWDDVGQSALVHVSTIHSFLWTVMRPFQADIRNWVKRRIEELIDELQRKAAGFGPRVQARTREKNAKDITRYREELQGLARAQPFTYGVGSNYRNGILGHNDIIRMTTQLVMERPLLRRVVAQQFPVIFVDESQDTMPAVVEALIAIQHTMGAAFCLGFFGDPMQKIYTTGAGLIALGEGWAGIKKPENFRCPATVLSVANNIRRDADGLAQTRGRMTTVNGELQSVSGTARLFLLPADNRRDENLHRVRDWIASTNKDGSWHSDDPHDVKVLVLVHRMAATRLGFPTLFSALNDKAPSAFKDGFDDASAWPLRPLWTLAIPLSDAIQKSRAFEAMALLRQLSPRLQKEALRGRKVSAILAELGTASQQLGQLMGQNSASTIRDVLEHIRRNNLIALDPKLVDYLDLKPPVGGDPDASEASAEIDAMHAFLKCPAKELWGYARYVNTQSPFSTQQGVKGAEFNRILVLLDDEEGKHNHFSYEKYFGLKALSETDIENQAAGNDSVIERTRRLFYVCCTRAVSDLAVVFFTEDPEATAQAAKAKDWFAQDEIRTLAAIIGC